jgi:hypothetical protein
MNCPKKDLNMLGDLYIQCSESQDLEIFSKRIFALLNVNMKEMRYSANAPGGRYVYGEVLALEVILSEADSSTFADYHFLITFLPKKDRATIDRHCLDGLADIVAKYLAENGMKVARPLQAGRIGTPIVLYGGDA